MTSVWSRCKRRTWMSARGHRLCCQCCPEFPGDPDIRPPCGVSGQVLGGPGSQPLLSSRSCGLSCGWAAGPVLRTQAQWRVDGSKAPCSPRPLAQDPSRAATTRVVGVLSELGSRPGAGGLEEGLWRSKKRRIPLIPCREEGGLAVRRLGVWQELKVLL